MEKRKLRLNKQDKTKRTDVRNPIYPKIKMIIWIGFCCYLVRVFTKPQVEGLKHMIGFFIPRFFAYILYRREVDGYPKEFLIPVRRTQDVGLDHEDFTLERTGQVLFEVNIKDLRNLGFDATGNINVKFQSLSYNSNGRMVEISNARSICSAHANLETCTRIKASNFNVQLRSIATLRIRNAISVSHIVHHWFDQRNCGPLTQKFLQTGLHESLVLFAMRSGLAWMDESFWLLPKINYRENNRASLGHGLEIQHGFPNQSLVSSSITEISNYGPPADFEFFDSCGFMGSDFGTVPMVPPYFRTTSSSLYLKMANNIVRIWYTQTIDPTHFYTPQSTGFAPESSILMLTFELVRILDLNMISRFKLQDVKILDLHIAFPPAYSFPGAIVLLPVLKLSELNYSVLEVYRSLSGLNVAGSKRTSKQSWGMRSSTRGAFYMMSMRHLLVRGGCLALSGTWQPRISSHVRSYPTTSSSKFNVQHSQLQHSTLFGERHQQQHPARPEVQVFRVSYLRKGSRNIYGTSVINRFIRRYPFLQEMQSWYPVLTGDVGGGPSRRSDRYEFGLASDKWPMLLKFFLLSVFESPARYECTEREKAEINGIAFITRYSTPTTGSFRFQNQVERVSVYDIYTII
ncbi:hypothetical protein C8Q75DRAFT_734952 [Abortiporus biennis]|nr:hypothetical protein C8Q75DRAFT_734952 [Abortiporus biennis]